MSSIFREINRNLTWWFGRAKKSKSIVKDILDKLENLKRSADLHDEQVRQLSLRERISASNAEIGAEARGIKIGLGHTRSGKENTEIERSFSIHKEKLEELDRWLPELKERIRDFFQISRSVRGIILQIDDLYHLKRTDQAFIVDYIHRLCKDLPLYFKIATLRHASTLYLDRDGQPTGIQERHDYQPINIDYTFSDFKKTANLNKNILNEFGRRADMSADETQNLFRGEGFNRLVMAGGGVPRDILSLFLEVLQDIDVENGGENR